MPDLQRHYREFIAWRFNITRKNYPVKNVRRAEKNSTEKKFQKKSLRMWYRNRLYSVVRNRALDI